MMYLIQIGGPILLDGPANFDVENEFRQWQRAIEARCGPEPNIFCYGNHQKWLLTYMLILREYQAKYKSALDFPHLFIEHLVQRCGFSRKEFIDVGLHLWLLASVVWISAWTSML